MFVELWRDERGLTMVEYALMMALVALSAVFSWQQMGDTTVNSVQTGTVQIANAG